MLILLLRKFSEIDNREEIFNLIPKTTFPGHNPITPFSQFNVVKIDIFKDLDWYPDLEKYLSTSYLNQLHVELAPGVNFTNVYMRSFYARKSQKRKMTDDLTAFLRFWDLRL